MGRKRAGEEIQLKARRFEMNSRLLNQWLKIRQDGKTLERFFSDNQFRTIAIYGMGDLGERLLAELAESSITIAYGIDRNAGQKENGGLQVYEPERLKTLPCVDVIVVTPVHCYWEIEQLLGGQWDVPAVSLQDVVEYCWEA